MQFSFLFPEIVSIALNTSKPARVRSNVGISTRRSSPSTRGSNPLVLTLNPWTHLLDLPPCSTHGRPFPLRVHSGAPGGSVTLAFLVAVALARSQVKLANAAVPKAFWAQAKAQGLVSIEL